MLRINYFTQIFGSVISEFKKKKEQKITMYPIGIKDPREIS